MSRFSFAPPRIVGRAMHQLRSRLSRNTQSRFDLIIRSLRSHLNNRSSRFDTPHSQRWLTVKLVPRKAIIAFRSKSNSLEFDIDTYPESGRDITDEEGLFRRPLRPYHHKPNKVYVAIISEQTPIRSVEYFIRKMINAIDLFEFPN